MTIRQQLPTSSNSPHRARHCSTTPHEYQNTAPVSPVFATLTDFVRNNPFPDTLIRKTWGVGGLRLPFTSRFLRLSAFHYQLSTADSSIPQAQTSNSRRMNRYTNSRLQPLQNEHLWRKGLKTLWNQQMHKNRGRGVGVPVEISNWLQLFSVQTFKPANCPWLGCSDGLTMTP